MSLDSGQQMIQIGSDGGLLHKPVRLDELILGPAERADVIIDFSNQSVGASIILNNTARNPFDFGEEADPLTTGLIIEFRVKEASSQDTSSIPQTLSVIKKSEECDAKKTRDITLDVGTDIYNRLLFILPTRKDVCSVF